jgi:hypothetical protein
MRGRRIQSIALFTAVFAMTIAAGERRAHANEQNFAQLKGEFEFGMTPQQVMDVLAKEIRAAYDERIQATRNVYQQDQLRRERQREITRVRRTYIEFKGEKTGWDVSLIDDQFAHNTGESMLVRWENDPQTGEDRRRFFFFHDGRLYKMFIALNPSGEARPFSQYQGLMQRRFGNGRVVYREDSQGTKIPVSINWQSRRYVVQALNKLEFYNSFCLMIADRERAQRVAQLREQNRRPDAPSQLSDVIVSDPNEDRPGLDEREHVVDRIIRQQ